MTNLDDTDMEILRLLGADGRRPFSDIASEVGLSGPAVSDRVERLRETGIIKRFTVDIDRTQLQAGVPVFVRVERPDGDIATLKERLGATQEVEHVFVTADGELWFHARTRADRVREWVEGLFEDAGTVEYTVTLMDEAEWWPSIEGSEFAVECAECGNTVDSEGESTRLGGQLYHFCCGSCQSQFEDRYDRFEADA